MCKSAENKGISGSTMKMIAIVSMLIDHIGASSLLAVIEQDPANYKTNGTMNATAIVMVYFALRWIGRLSFPIFIFILIEGYTHTKNRWMYLLRLFLFAFISEVPFDLALNIKADRIRSGQFLEFTYQNVFFTLVIGFLVIIAIDTFWHTGYELQMRLSLCVISIGAGCALAWIMKTDYDAWGVASIALAYVIRRVDNRFRMAGPCLLLSVMQLAEGLLPTEMGIMMSSVIALPCVSLALAAATVKV